MPYLTAEEEAKFSEWLGETPNPATRLLAEFRTHKRIESLADLEQLAQHVQDFYTSLSNIINENKQSKIELTDHPGIVLHQDTATLDIIFPLSAFCLVQSGINKNDFQNLMNYCEYFTESDTRKSKNKLDLKNILNYLNEQEALLDNDASTSLKETTDAPYT